jgi:hypothetical protein
MNPIVLYFASGESLYPGAAILMLAILSSPFLQHRWLLRLRSVAVWLALIMIIMACPPFPWTVDVVFVATYLLWYVATNLSVGHSAQRLANALLAAMLIVLSGFELQQSQSSVDLGDAERPLGYHRRFNLGRYRSACAVVAGCAADNDWHPRQEFV